MAYFVSLIVHSFFNKYRVPEYILFFSRPWEYSTEQEESPCSSKAYFLYGKKQIDIVMSAM